MEKLCKWKRGMELKGLRVNIGKTKVMRCQVRIGQAEETGKYPCGVCRQGVVTIPSGALLATNGFIKGVVVFQVDWGMLLISAARGVWRGPALVVLLSEVELEPGVKVECVQILLFG